MPTKQVTSIARKHLTRERHGYICYYKVYVSSVSALLLSSILTYSGRPFWGLLIDGGGRGDEKAPLLKTVTHIEQ